MNKKPLALINILLVGALLAGALFVASRLSNPDEATPVSMAVDSIVLSEIMVQNASLFHDEDGDSSDWVELHNQGPLAINLQGLSLTDRENEPARSPLSDITIEANGYAVIWLSGKNRSGHTTFKMKNGETISLTNASGEILSTIECKDIPSNQSYALQEDGTWLTTNEITPGFPNTPQGYSDFMEKYIKIGSSDLRLSEIMSANASTIADLDGEFSDWIEIVNTGSTPIDLSGFSLSDNPSDPAQWSFLKGTLQGGEHMLVFASGKDLKEEEIPHTNFKITASGETITLCSPDGIIIDKVDLPELKSDESYVFSPLDDTWSRTFEPTPGLANDEISRTAMAQRILAANKGLAISEVMSGNAGVYTVDGVQPDWVEIVNRTGQEIDLLGYGLSNTASRPLRWQFPKEILQNNERIIVALDGTNLKKQVNHTDFRISLLGGEQLILSSPTGELLDKIILPSLRQDVSYGRDEAMNGLFYFPSPTPLQANVQGKPTLAKEPILQTKGGMVPSGTQISVLQPEGYTLRYTTDCTEPTATSAIFTTPLTIDKTTVVRIASFAENAIASRSVSATYLVGAQHTVPIVALVTDPVHLFDFEQGIFADGPGYTEEFPHSGANYWKDWEKPIHVELYGDDLFLSQNAGLQTHGQYSRALPQKSMALYASSQYGTSTFDAPLLPNRDYTQYKSFLLRSTGQDNNRARMRDAVLTSLAKDSGVLYQDTRTVVVYLNGVYWGHYNLRERINKNSVAQFEGIDLSNHAVVDNIDIVKANRKVLNGSAQGYRDIIDFINKNSLTNEENLTWVTDRVDVLNYFNYQAMEILVGNSDNGNIKFYNTNLPGSKWKWILYDLDWSFNTGESRGVAWDTLSSYLDPAGTGVGKQFENVLFRKLLENPTMKDLFLERLAFHYKNTYTKERVNARIDEYVAIMAPEMEQHYAKWPDDGSVSSWNRHIGYLRAYIEKRPAFVYEHIENYFHLSAAQMEALFGVEPS